MVRTVFSGEEVASVLTDMGYRPTDRKGSHLQLRYVNEDTGEVRNVTVPMHDEIAIGALQQIADQCGAEDFRSRCEWIDQHC
jgi:predicted RNA binding protein YcfA (HicA-like mRNA interferase family)